jgi:hypothetical protein
MFAPARTLFVAQSWSSGADPTVFFTTIAGALAQAAMMTPAQGNPVAVIIFPGTYTEIDPNTGLAVPLRIPSWVFLSSASTHQNAVTIGGTVTWTPTGNAFEVVQLYFLNILGRTTVTTTGKTGGQTTFILQGCFVSGGLDVIGRSASGNTRDLVFAANCVPSMNALTLDSCLFEWLAGRLNGMTFKTTNGACRFRIIGGTTVPGIAPGADWFVNGTSQGICIGDNFTHPDFPNQPGWTLGPGTSVVFGGCSLAKLTVAAGATADIRSSECSSLSGPGTVNRRSLTMSFGPTVQGANPVPFAVPFPDGAYNVSLQRTEGTSGAPVTTGNKTGAGFTINDAPGNTYDVTVIHD